MEIQVLLPRAEPKTFRLLVRMLHHWATGDSWELSIKQASVFYMGNESCQLTHNSESYENSNVSDHFRLAIAFIYLLSPACRRHKQQPFSKVSV